MPTVIFVLTTQWTLNVSNNDWAHIKWCLCYLSYTTIWQMVHSVLTVYCSPEPTVQCLKSCFNWSLCWLNNCMSSLCCCSDSLHCCFSCVTSLFFCYLMFSHCCSFLLSSFWIIVKSSVVIPSAFCSINFLKLSISCDENTLVTVIFCKLIAFSVLSVNWNDSRTELSNWSTALLI